MVVNGRTDSTVRIGRETAQRVWRAVREVGYVANPVAQRLARGRNRLLGVFTHEAVFPVDHGSFYHPFLVGIEREAEDRGYDLLLFTSTRGDDGVRSIFRDGVNSLLVASGSVLLGWAEDRDEIRQLAESGYPFAYVGRRDIEGVPIAYAGADYASATEEVVDHLVALGHRRILYLGSLPEREATIDRRRGFALAMARHGLRLDEPVGIRVHPDEVTAELLIGWRREGWSALVVEDDILAEPILAVAAGALRVPDDLSLAVLGDPLVHTEVDPRWTTFRIPRFEMGRQAAALLIDRIEGPDEPSAPHVVLPCAFSPGWTTGPLEEVRR
jgi:DNA-binding LacI/PurR family transcriptional regulator